jgi:hypothetical protein
MPSKSTPFTKLRWRIWHTHCTVRPSMASPDALGAARLRCDSFGLFHGLDLRPVVRRRVSIHPTIATERKPELAILVDADEPQCLRFSDRARNSTATQSVVYELIVSDRQTAVVVGPMVR